MECKHYLQFLESAKRLNFQEKLEFRREWMNTRNKLEIFQNDTKNT